MLVEVFEPHADAPQECSDDDVAAAAVSPSAADGIAASVATVELTLPRKHEIPPSVLYGPAPKVPKLLS